jgi:triosephosphate isomerase
MNRKPFIAGNWKMNLDRAGCVALAQQVAKAAANVGDVELACIPPFVYIDAVAQVLKGSKVGWGAQDVYQQGNGAFTGEVSIAMLKDLGCQYVVLGHSERRHVLGETDVQVNQKTLAALAGGLVPIVCVGELLEEREAGQTMQVIERQIGGSLAGLTPEQMQKTVIAYEPVWAIGTGKVATPAQAEEVHLALRKMLESRYNREVAQAVRLQYGGSVKPDNARELLAQPDIDGALVGGAALKADQFMGIVAGLAK